MLDFFLLSVSATLAIGLTLLSLFQKPLRFIPTLIAGVLWLAIAFMIFDMSLIFSISCIGMGFWMFIRSIET